ncbi:GGDEF domain-containing protein [Vibrio sp. DW001]|uniref:diguanylate cyclase n=1 Tax=Vibrio sp. DW001 TaxID=2912315 RepID=UPI0023B12B4E|nr:diguanylate cyclase [Vibrio sp. DW001]WED29271.1 GGDEF domain-containing protein [Vibrio sp. DW001]
MLEALVLNVIVYSVLPLYFLTLNSRVCIASLYGYIAITLFVGGLAGAIYSFPFSESLNISGGNLAYGAFMMSTVMLIIIENDTCTFRNMIRLVLMVDTFVFFGFSFMAWLLGSGLVIDPYNLPPSIFYVSFLVLVIGGVLILGEILLLLFVFQQVRKYFSSLFSVTSIFTLTFILILCADGIFFPLVAFALGLSPVSVNIIFGNILGKLIIAICYSFPLLGFYLIFRQKLSRFISTPLSLNELFGAPRDQLLDTLQRYEIRDKQLQRDKKELTEIAERDRLTSLANRHKFDVMFEKEWYRCQREGQSLTLVIGDIDFFKQYNDTYGHHQGDECLKKVARLWGNIFERSSDLPARIGGEEFAVIVPNSSSEETLFSLQNFLVILQENKIPHSTSSISPYVTMSIGVASIIPNKEFSTNDLFVTADKCLYSAKHAGRNTIIVKSLI